MPLSKIQSEVLLLLAVHRNPESYVGVATPLNRNAPRFSSDIDVFHDREERVSQAALNDAAVTKGDDGTRLEWVVDACGQRRGQWPTSAKITEAMWERYQKPPTL